jgi:DNA invertase Pin-like site-specific DNA recombinase
VKQDEGWRIALYPRVSKRESNQDTENQLVQLRHFAQTQKWNVVHEYVDRATAKHNDRDRLRCDPTRAPVSIS